MVVIVGRDVVGGNVVVGVEMGRAGAVVVESGAAGSMGMGEEEVEERMPLTSSSRVSGGRPGREFGSPRHSTMQRGSAEGVPVVVVDVPPSPPPPLGFSGLDG